MKEHIPLISVRDPDGRLVPFQADRVCQTLFAATEALGRPDPFLARELTDAVSQFLADQYVGDPPAPDDLAELVEKVVRELGQPSLARRYAELRRFPDPTPLTLLRDDWRDFLSTAPSPLAVARFAASQRLTTFSLSDVFPNHLVAAQNDGLLTLLGLDHPLELSATVLGPGSRPDHAGQGLLESLERVREYCGGWVAIDAPEYALAAVPGEPPALAAEYARELRAGLRSTGLAAVVNLNVAVPPTWGRELGGGPLFAELRQTADFRRLREIADALRDELVIDSAAEVTWHLRGFDFTGESKERLRRTTSLHDRRMTYCFDRPRRPVSLAPGVTRKHPAVLLAVAVHLPRLAEMNAGGKVSDFLKRLGTLARLARGAGHAKQDFLRHRSRAALSRGFLLDRARLVVVPVGLEAVVRTWTGHRLSDGGPGEELARQILAHLRDALSHEKPRTMDACLDSAPPSTDFRLPGPTSDEVAGVAGLTPWGYEAPPQQQLRSGGTLHQTADGGTAAVVSNDADHTTSLLKYAWSHTDLCRVRRIAPD